MHINNPEVLDDFMKRHREATDAIRRWKRRVRVSRWNTPYDVRVQTSDVTILRGSRLIFHIMGDDYRLVAKVNYVAGTVDVRFVGTHKKYDDINPLEV